MDCVQAQQLLSEAFDAELVDAARLAEAKSHCAGCPECTGFARGLLVLRTPGPTAPESLIGAVVARVESEIAQQAAAEAAAKAAAATADTRRAADGAAAAASATAAADSAIPRKRPSRWQTGWGIAAAAAVVIGFAMLTQYGIRLMADPFGTGQEAARTANDSVTSTDLGSAPAPGAESQSQGQRYAEAAKAPAFVVFRGQVYRLHGSRETSGAAVASIGSVKTARDGSGSPSAVTVYSDPTSSNGLLLPSEGSAPSYVAFVPVTRTLKGRTYVLSSEEDIDRFGEWPKLPSKYPEPASPDGSPIFFDGGADDAGAKIFVPRGGEAEDGFAIAPSMPAADPSAGNPNWTWWSPYF